MTPTPAIYAVTPSGPVVCRCCHAVGPAHAPDCPILLVRLQLQELSVQLGLFVATMRETVETLDGVLRGPADPPG